MMNNTVVRESSARLADRLASAKGSAEAIRIGYAFALGRAPRPAELADSLAFLQEQRASYLQEKKPNAEHLALTDFCQVLLGLNEFILCRLRWWQVPNLPISSRPVNRQVGKLAATRDETINDHSASDRQPHRVGPVAAGLPPPVRLRLRHAGPCRAARRPGAPCRGCATADPTRGFNPLAHETAALRGARPSRSSGCS